MSFRPPEAQFDKETWLKRKAVFPSIIHTFSESGVFDVVVSAFVLEKIGLKTEAGNVKMKRKSNDLIIVNKTII